MPRVVFIQADGREQSVQAVVGASVMQTATGAGVPGIVAECGGSAMCATCHVYVDPEVDRPDSGAVGERRLEMLECTAADRLDNSRLSCQIKATEALDGLVIRIPDRQQ